MIRPYKNIQEFLDRTKLKLGSIFYCKSFDLLNDESTRQVMLIGLEPSTNSVCFSGSWHTLKQLKDGYLLSTDGKAFNYAGVIISASKIQFEVGSYYGIEGLKTKYKVTNRYEDDGYAYVVLDNKTTMRVFTDPEENSEYLLDVSLGKDLYATDGVGKM